MYTDTFFVKFSGDRTNQKSVYKVEHVIKMIESVCTCTYTRVCVGSIHDHVHVHACVYLRPGCSTLGGSGGERGGRRHHFAVIEKVTTRMRC